MDKSSMERMYDALSKVQRKTYQVTLHENFIEIAWMEGSDNKSLILKPRDIVKLYYNDYHCPHCGGMMNAFDTLT